MADIDDKALKEIGELLNTTISNSIYGPPGDPVWSELAAAAASMKILQLLGLKVKGEKDVRSTLSKENICNENFLETFDIK